VLIAAANVTDSDGDNIPDHLELPQFRTGLSASGCSIGPNTMTDAQRLSIDPMLLGLAVLAGVYMLNRRRSKVRTKEAIR
jgi:hypothetical protein